MKDQRIETVTEHLKQLRDLSGKLYEILAPEVTSYEIIRGDLELKRDEMKRVEAERQTALAEVESAKRLTKSILDTAKEEASRLVSSGKSVMIEKVQEANRILESCSEFALKVDKERYMKLRKEIEKAEKVNV